MPPRKSFLTWAGATVLGLLIAGPASAARLLHFSVEHDGKTVLDVLYDDDGRAPPAVVWGYLGRVPIGVDTSPKLRASTEDPLRARLEGPVVVRLSHGGHALAEAHISGLTLVRMTAGRYHWPRGRWVTTLVSRV